LIDPSQDATTRTALMVALHGHTKNTQTSEKENIGVSVLERRKAKQRRRRLEQHIARENWKASE